MRHGRIANDVCGISRHGVVMNIVVVQFPLHQTDKIAGTQEELRFGQDMRDARVCVRFQIASSLNGGIESANNGVIAC